MNFVSYLSPEVILEIDGICKEYVKGIRANDGVSLSIKAGEVFGLLGPNGAGKTTLVSRDGFEPSTP